MKVIKTLSGEISITNLVIPNTYVLFTGVLWECEEFCMIINKLEREGNESYEK